MRYIINDLFDSIKNNKGLYAMIIFSQLIGSICLMIIYGIYVNYENKQKEILINEKTIEVDFDGVTVGQLRTSLQEMLGEIEDEIDYMYVLTGYDQLLINCHFEYHNGQYTISEKMRENTAISKGRYFSESDISTDKKVIVMGGNHECGIQVDIDLQPVEVIGYSGIEFENNASWMWINHCPENLKVELMIFNYKELPTFNSYTHIKEFFEESFMGKAQVQEFDVHDEEALISIRTVIFMSLAIGVIIALNTALLFGYLIRKRRKDMAVLAIVGASKSHRFRLFICEIGFISLADLLMGELFFRLVLERQMNRLYGCSVSYYDVQTYLLLGGVYFACIIFIMFLVVAIMNQIKIKEMLRRVSHD